MSVVARSNAKRPQKMQRNSQKTKAITFAAFSVRYPMYINDEDPKSRCRNSYKALPLLSLQPQAQKQGHA